MLLRGVFFHVFIGLVPWSDEREEVNEGWNQRSDSKQVSCFVFWVVLVEARCDSCKLLKLSDHQPRHLGLE